ncbi:uncharacterized protein O3C94_018717 isoform 2-T2 [Discoglossus pictus]
MTKTIGIFSRCGKYEYEWLTTELKAVGNVRPFYISNYNNSLFREEVNKCTSAILYHSKKRGRVNITNVNDSLYDEELNYLFQKLGRQKVIVVADDLDDSGPDTKLRILQSQPSIGRMANKLFLFTTEEKHNSILMRSKIEDIKSLITSGSFDYISRFKRLFFQNNPWNVLYFLIFLLLLVGVWLYILPFVISILFYVLLIVIIILIGSLAVSCAVSSANTMITWQKVILVIGTFWIETFIISKILPISLLATVIFTTLSTGTGVWIISQWQHKVPHLTGH